VLAVTLGEVNDLKRRRELHCVLRVSVANRRFSVSRIQCHAPDTIS